MFHYEMTDIGHFIIACKGPGLNPQSGHSKEGAAANRPLVRKCLHALQCFAKYLKGFPHLQSWASKVVGWKKTESFQSFDMRNCRNNQVGRMNIL